MSFASVAELNSQFVLAAAGIYAVSGCASLCALRRIHAGWIMLISAAAGLLWTGL